MINMLLRWALDHTVKVAYYEPYSIIYVDVITMGSCVSIPVSFPRVISSIELRSRDDITLGKDTRMDYIQTHVITYTYIIVVNNTNIGVYEGSVELNPVGQ